MSGHDEQIAPQRLAKIVKDGMAVSESRLNVYWYEVGGDRDEYARDFRRSVGADPIVVLIVRNSVFDNPNAVLSDMTMLMNRHQDLFQDQLVGPELRPDRIGIVLLTRTTLGLPQISSPITLPLWFPHFGGETISVVIQDVTWTGTAPLDCIEAAIPQLRLQLFDLDGALLRRISSVFRTSRNESDSFWSHMRGVDGTSLEAFIDDSIYFRDTEVHDASTFRPDATKGRTLVALIWRTMQHTEPEKVGRVGEALARALMLPSSFDLGWHQSMMSILARPANRLPAERTVFASNVLRSIAFSSQFITVAAHADSYTGYPVSLLRTISYDLRRSLAGARTIISNIDQV